MKRSRNSAEKQGKERNRRQVKSREKSRDPDKESFSIVRKFTGLSLQEHLHKRKLERILSGKEKEKEKGISTEQTITFTQMSPDGICMVKEGYYTLMIELADANYKIRDRNERLAMLDQYAQILNSFDPSINFQIMFFSQHLMKWNTMTAQQKR